MTRIGILGCGSFIQRRILPIQGLNVVAIQKRDLKKAQEIASQYHIPHAVATREELLALPDVDLVFIGTQNHLHEADCLACAEHNKPTLCEKPLAPTSQAILRIIEAFEKKSLPLFVGHSMRFRPALQQIRKMVHENALGPISHIHIYFGCPTSQENWRWQKEKGGGVLQDIGVHLFDLCEYLTHEEIVSIHAIADSKDGLEYTVRAKLTLTNNVTAHIECSQRQDFGNGVEIEGSLSRIISTNSLRQTNEPIETLVQKNGSEHHFKVFPSNIYQEELAHVAKVLAGETTSLIPPQIALKSEKVIEAAYKSIASGREERIE